MKYSASLLALAVTALGNKVQQRGDYDDYDDDYGYEKDHTTMTTYTTVTTCPVTSTYTKEGSTYCVTDLTTSTIVVTECHGCGVKTVPGKDTTVYDQKTRYATRTTVLPVTETYTEAGKLYTKTYVTTKTVDEVIPTTYYKSVQQPDTTKKVQETYYATRTSLHPVTETKYINGEYVTKVYTTTKLVEEVVPTKIYESVQLPDTTKKVQETVYLTKTSLSPYTKYVTVGGKVETEVHTSTKIIVTQVPTVIEKTKTLPGTTETEYEVKKITKTEEYPVTKVRTEKGEAVTEVYTSTKVVVETIPTTIEQVKTIYETNSAKEVHTKYSKAYITVGGGTVVKTQPAKPTTYVVPETSVVEIPPATVTSQQAPPATSAPASVPTAAAHINQAPVALMAVLAGIVALF